jgi:hypothetical protein
MFRKISAAKGRFGFMRAVLARLWPILTRSLRILALLMIAMGPNAPPPPLPRPAPIEARAEDSEGDDEEP